jgi:hypothetical protein
MGSGARHSMMGTGSGANFEKQRFCVKGCEFLIHEEYSFFCKFYEVGLTNRLTLSGNSLRPTKCDECMSEGDERDRREKKNTIREYLVKIRNYADLVEEEIRKL